MSLLEPSVQSYTLCNEEFVLVEKPIKIQLLCEKQDGKNDKMRMKIYTSEQWGESTTVDMYSFAWWLHLFE